MSHTCGECRLFTRQIFTPDAVIDQVTIGAKILLDNLELPPSLLRQAKTIVVDSEKGQLILGQSCYSQDANVPSTRPCQFLNSFVPR